jgi:two-component system, NtrC family, response regulator AtoC
MQDSGPMPSQKICADMLKTKSTGSLSATMPASLITQVAELPLTSLPQPQPPVPDGAEPLDGRRAFIAVSPAMREVRRQLEQVAGIDGVVLLLGESGTGKEVVARMIHKLSWRASREFLKVNCAALPVDLLESELFGHEAGTVNGARPGDAEKDEAGKIEICNKGTILLDEIAALPLSSQAKLLHLLQDGEFSRLGSASTLQADVRVLATTNADVRQAVQNGILRADLYYRLNVFCIHLPPLRDRREDLPHLLSHFMNTWAAAYGRPRLPITRRILEVCASYPWPGNVRELQNFVKRYLVMGDESLAISQLDHRPEPDAAAAPVNSSLPVSLAANKPGGCDLKSVVRGLKQKAERTAIIQALEQTRGNKQEAASLLRISLRALHYKVRAYAIEPITRVQDRAPALASPNVRPMPPVSAYPLARAANDGPRFSGPGPGNGKLTAQGDGKLASPGSGKLISMERSSYLPVR